MTSRKRSFDPVHEERKRAREDDDKEVLARLYNTRTPKGTYREEQLSLLKALRGEKSEARLKEEIEGKGRPVRVYADGVYDMFHYGHARSLEQAKKLFPHVELVVGVCDNTITHAMKGRTVMDEEQRAESVRHCKWVDEVVEHIPWIITAEFIKEHRIDYVAHGEDISRDEDGNDVYGVIKEAGFHRTIKRTEGISTSDLILHIVRDYDAYVKRNLKRGFSAKEMNVSLLKRAQLEISDHVQKFEDTSNRLVIEPIAKFVSEFNRTWSKGKNRVIELVKNYASGDEQEEEEEGEEEEQEEEEDSAFEDEDGPK